MSIPSTNKLISLADEAAESGSAEESGSGSGSEAEPEPESKTILLFVC